MILFDFICVFLEVRLLADAELAEDVLEDVGGGDFTGDGAEGGEGGAEVFGNEVGGGAGGESGLYCEQTLMCSYERFIVTHIGNQN